MGCLQTRLLQPLVSLFSSWIRLARFAAAPKGLFFLKKYVFIFVATTPSCEARLVHRLSPSQKHVARRWWLLHTECDTINCMALVFSSLPICRMVSLVVRAHIPIPPWMNCHTAFISCQGYILVVIGCVLVGCLDGAVGWWIVLLGCVNRISDSNAAILEVQRL